MPENGFLTARKAYVAGQRQFASDTGCTAPYAGDRHDRRTAQAHQHVVQRPKAARTWWKARRLLRSREEVVVGEEEAGHRAAEHDNLNLLIAFNRGDDVVELRNGLRTEYIQRR